MRQACLLAKACTSANWAVVTGGEAGVDWHAAKTAFEAGGRSIIALGAGIFAHGRQYHDFYKSIATSGYGCVISAVPTSVPPRSDNQITGDLLSTGLAKALSIVEASETSGALIAARAMEITWRRPIYAFPGPIDSPWSRGTNQLLYQRRATPIISIEQFISDLNQYRLPIKSSHKPHIAAVQSTAPEPRH